MFDAYHKWLGIRPGRRPPTYYQLLGIAPEEEDREVIEEAAIRQTAHVRTYQIGPQAAEATRLLNEIAQARTTLLSPARRKEYDARLAVQARKKVAEGLQAAPHPFAQTGAAATEAFSFGESSDAPAEAEDQADDLPRRRRGRRPVVSRGSGFGAKVGMLLAIAIGGIGGSVGAYFLFFNGPKKPPAGPLGNAQANVFPQVANLNRPDPPPVFQPPVVPKNSRPQPNAQPGPNPIPQQANPQPNPNPVPPPNPLRPQANPIVVFKGNGQTGFKGVVGAVSHLVISPDGRRALSASGTTVQVWELPAGKELYRFALPSNVLSLEFSPDGRRALLGTGYFIFDNGGQPKGQDCALRLWDVENQKLLKTFPQLSGVRAVAFSPDGRRALSGSGMSLDRNGQKFSADCAMRLWDLESGEEVRQFPVPDRPVNYVGFYPDGQLGFSISPGCFLVRWDLNGGRELMRALPNIYRDLAISPDGERIVYSDLINLRLLDREANQLRSIPLRSTIASVAISPDKRFALAGGQGMVWANGRPLVKDGQQVKVPPKVTLVDLVGGWELAAFEGHTGPVTSVAFSPDGRFALSGGADKTIRLWDLGKYLAARPAQPPRGKAAREQPLGLPTSKDLLPDKAAWAREAKGKKVGELYRFVAHGAPVTSVALSRYGRYALSGGDDNTARLWDVENGVELRRLQAVGEGKLSVALLPDGLKAVLGSAWNSVQLYDLNGGGGHGYAAKWPLGCIAVSPRGDKLLLGSNGMFNINGLEPQSLQMIRNPSFGTPVNTLFSPTGPYLFFTNEKGKVQMYDPGRKLLVGGLRTYKSPVLSLACSTDGRYLITGAMDKTVRIWDVKTGHQYGGVLKGHEGPVTSVAVSATGHILSGSGDRTLRLWDLKSHKLLETFTGHTGRVMSVAISRDGRVGVSGSEDKTVRVWWLPK